MVMTSVTMVTARLSRVGIPGTLTCSPPLMYSVSQPAKNSSPYCPPWEEPNPKAEKHGESYIDRAFALRRFTESAGAKHHVEQQDCHRHTQDDEPLELDLCIRRARSSRTQVSSTAMARRGRPMTVDVMTTPRRRNTPLRLPVTTPAYTATAR